MYFHQNIHFQRRKRRSCNWSVRLLLESIKQSFPRFPGDELDDEGQTWHESSLLQPEDGGQTSLNWGKNHNPLSMSGILGVDPLQSPVRLLLDSGEVLNGVEQPVPLLPVLDVRHLPHQLLSWFCLWSCTNQKMPLICVYTLDMQHWHLPPECFRRGRTPCW